MLVALRCPQCQGGLPPLAAGQTTVTCPYCGMTLMLQPPAVASPDEERRERIMNFLGALRIERPFPDALAVTLENVLPDPAAARGVARAMVRVLDEFRAQTGIDASKENMCVLRLLDAWMEVREALTREDTAALRLPYFAADQNGPRHLERIVARADLARLEGGKQYG